MIGWPIVLSPFKRLAITLIGISIIYIGVVRPIQTVIIHKWVVPYFEKINPVDGSVAIEGVSEDQFDLVTPHQSVKIELPFNGWYWLTLGLFFSAGNMGWIKWLTIYHLFLFAVLFLGAHCIFAGFDWFAIILNIHEHIYKVLFLIVSLIGLKPILMNRIIKNES
jgi:hypothetical protein